MRTAGVVTGARDLGPHDHCCWAFSEAADFHARAAEFLADGLRLGLKLLYMGSGPVDELARHLHGLDGLDALLASGRLVLSSLDEEYAAGACVDPPAQVAHFGRLADEAVAEGYAGMRAAADVTALVRTPEQLDAFARYEHLVDRHMASHPVSGMCGYDIRAVGAKVVEQLACLHPLASSGSAPFRLFDAGLGRLGLAGEFDHWSLELLDTTLDRIPPVDGSGALAVDVSAVEFADHRLLFALARHAERRGVRVDLVSPPPMLERVASMLDVPGVRAAAVA